jgi:hypothetical protein
LSLGADVERRQFVANQTLLTTCLRDQGFDYEPIEYSSEWDLVDLVSPLDRRFAEARGYHLPAITPVDANSELYDDPSFGASYDECGRSANARVFRTADNYAQSAQALSQDLRATLERFAASSEGAVVVEAWGECMSRRGYEYASPSDPAREFQEASDVTDDELRVRIADLDCDEEVGFTVRRFAWESDVVGRWMADHAGEIAALQTEGASVLRSLTELEAELAED